MFVKFSKLVFKVDVDIVKGWHEIEAEIIVRKERKNLIKRKAIDIILKNRKIINKYIDKSDKELREMLKAMPNLNYDRAGTLKTRSPFRILRNTH